jgi:hypothetical protein
MGGRTVDISEKCPSVRTQSVHANQGRRRFFLKITGNGKSGKSGNLKKTGNGESGKLGKKNREIGKRENGKFFKLFFTTTSTYIWFNNIQTIANHLIINTRSQSMANFHE